MVNITRKITLGYIILIFIPVMAFGYHYYTQIHGSLTKQYAEGRQKILEQAYSNMKMDFTRIESIHRVLQYNSYVTDYLDGVYDTELENVYSFIRYIRPLYAQALFANPEIDSLLIYTKGADIFTITDHFVEWEFLDSQIEESLSTLKPGSGLWVRVDPDSLHSELIYYQHLYNTQFTEIIGLLEIRINDSFIKKFFEAAGVQAPWEAFFLVKGEVVGNLPMPIHDSVFELVNSEADTFIIDRQNVINQLVLEELGVHVFIAGKVDDVFHSLTRSEVIVIIILFLLLVGLSLVYYWLATSITKRILKLARHMRTLNEDNLRQSIFKQKSSKKKDEIGFLIETYNSMLHRMDELINNVHRAELLNKEAAYKVLQAQIKPHFLYNTLETIRMLAETNNDKEVADISFWFGKLMRYSLSSEQDEVTLAQEIDMAKFYLQIHKTRLQDRLTYEIDVSMDAAKVICPRFIIQPLIENSINHGVSAVIRPVHIRLAAKELEEEIRLYVMDNGNGIQAEKLVVLQSLLLGGDKLRESATITGVGLINVNDRIKAFFGGTSRLEVHSEFGKGASFCIIIDKRRGK
ncbi:sensor histidine kinase [Paenibacillus septentrionalis]|uniref:sensor histidine kinase n=1 Tax=Paenibacillus septentrionalis TaxID=429342 RepID=UPI003645EC36